MLESVKRVISSSLLDIQVLDSMDRNREYMTLTLSTLRGALPSPSDMNSERNSPLNLPEVADLKLGTYRFAPIAVTAIRQGYKRCNTSAFIRQAFTRLVL